MVFGVSIDPPADHKAFKDKLGIPFDLIADEDGSVSTAFDSVIEQGGEKYSARKIVLIGKDGVVKYRDDQYKVGDKSDFDALAAAVAAL